MPRIKVWITKCIPLTSLLKFETEFKDAFRTNFANNHNLDHVGGLLSLAYPFRFQRLFQSIVEKDDIINKVKSFDLGVNVLC